MLSAAEQLGMPIRRIELGNELYYRAPLVVKAFPTAAAYGREASRWIAAIKARYPKAQIAAVGLGYPPAAGDERQASWDRAVRRTLRGEDAVAFHAYWPASRRRSLSGATLSQELAAPLRLLRALRSDGLSKLPKGVEAWVTEWNLWHGAGYRGTWANGLADATYLLGLLGEPSVSQEDLHPLVHSQPQAALFGNPSGFHAGDRGRSATGGPRWARRSASSIRPCGGARQCAGWMCRRRPKLRGTGIAAVRGVAVEGSGRPAGEPERAAPAAPAERRAVLRRDAGLGVGAAIRAGHRPAPQRPPLDERDRRATGLARALGQPPVLLRHGGR